MTDDDFQFWLGTHVPNWLHKCDIPLMVSNRRLRGYKKLTPATCQWFLDSGGFTELSLNGTWTIGVSEYVDQIHRYMTEIGNLKWVSPQDWMCEPWIIAKTGLSVEEHQRRTIANLLELRDLIPEAPIIPVLQGWSIGDYASHLSQYLDAGIDLRDEPMVGLGSVCRRQATDEIGEIVAMLHGEGLRLHGFGCKMAAVKKYGHMLASADSMAWSFGGRYISPCPQRPVANCANCLHHAMDWRDKLLTAKAEAER